MSNASNAELVRRYFDDCVARLGGPEAESALSILDELLTDGFAMTYGNDTDDAAVRGRDQHKAFLMAHQANYPDDRWTIDALVASDTKVACQWRIRSRHAKTGNSIDIRAADIFTVRDGRLDGLRRFLDFNALDEQTRLPRAARQEAAR